MEWQNNPDLQTAFLHDNLVYFWHNNCNKKTKGMTPRDTAFSSILGIVSVVVTYIGVALFIKG